MTVEYRPLWWRPWLDPAPSVPEDSDAPDVTGFQFPAGPEPSAPPASLHPRTTSDERYPYTKAQLNPQSRNTKPEPLRQ
jgi:hypothetical protein